MCHLLKFTLPSADKGRPNPYRPIKMKTLRCVKVSNLEKEWNRKVTPFIFFSASISNSSQVLKLLNMDRHVFPRLNLRIALYLNQSRCTYSLYELTIITTHCIKLVCKFPLFHKKNWELVASEITWPWR